MVDISGGDGKFIWPSIDRLAAYTKLNPRTVQRLIHGYGPHKGLLERGILSELNPANGAKHKTVTYQLNVDALLDDPAMERYLNRQQQLTGIRRIPINGEPIPERTPVTLCHPMGGAVSPNGRHSVIHPGGSVSPNSKAFDSRTIDSTPMIHGDCERCNGSGMRLSYSTPGKFVVCECTGRAQSGEPA
jgi:hypothetical protein